MLELLIHWAAGWEANGYPIYPDDVPDHHDCPHWELALVVEDEEAWHPEAVATGLTVPEARNLARSISGATRVIGDLSS